MSINPLCPHDALKNHFTFLKRDLIFLQLGVLEWIFPCNCSTNTRQFSLICHPFLNHLHPLQIENCVSNSRFVVGEDDSCKFRPEVSVKVILIETDTAATNQDDLKGLAQAKIIKKSVILFRVLNMTI